METSRKRRSNEARLQAMEDRARRMERSKSIISASLKGKTISESKHVTFESDSDDNNILNGHKHRDIFGEDCSESDTEYKLPDKPQFEGYSGAKLFKLQQRSRNDDRFQLDERFAEAVSENSETDEKRDDNFVVEKQKNLQILGDVLGKDIRAQKRPIREIVDLIRFDPTLDSHKKYIIQKEDGENTDVINTSLVSTALETIEIPEVTKQTYYEYENTKSIASLFEKTQSDNKIEPDVFNFEIKETEQMKLTQPYSFEHTQVSTVSQLIDTEHHFGVEERDSESELGKVESRNIIEETERRNLFFFHTTNSKLRNRIDDIKFCRKQDIDTLNREWHEKAALLMRDCKRKHRDAIRWKRKSISIN